MGENQTGRKGFEVSHVEFYNFDTHITSVCVCLLDSTRASVGQGLHLTSFSNMLHNEWNLFIIIYFFHLKYR